MAARIYSVPPEEPLAEPFSLWIDGEKAPIQRMYVSAAPINRRWPGHQREISQREEAYFVLFAMEETAQITVDMGRDFTEAVVRPLSKEVEVHREGSVLRFTLPRPGGYTLEVDGHHHALHLLADPMDGPGSQAPQGQVIYYGPGVHHEPLITLHSNETLFLDEGAVVYGSVRVKDADNVRILGRGILDNSLNREKILYEVEEVGDGSMAVPNAERTHAIDICDCRGLEIGGITVRDALTYNIALLGCERVRIDGVKIIGSWRYNSDGIDVHNCKRVFICNCFIRTYDDCLCVKGNFGYTDPTGWDEKPVYRQNCEGYEAVNCVLWCDWGRAMEIGAETRVDEISRIVFRGSDIIHSCHYAMDIQNVDHAYIHDVLFADIHVEYEKSHQRPYIQTRDGESYPEDPDDDYMPGLMCAVVYEHPEYSGGLSRRGRIECITYMNIQVHADRMPPSYFEGYDSEHMTRDLYFAGIVFNGRELRALEQTGVELGPWTGDITFKCFEE